MWWNQASKWCRPTSWWPDSLATLRDNGETRNFIRHEDDEVPPEIPVKFQKNGVVADHLTAVTVEK